jgi:hypothetical protein
MVAFEVYVNGKRICTVGIGDNGVLTTIVSWVTGPPERSDLFLQVGGLRSPSREDVTWREGEPLRVGDEVRIGIVERTKVDRPRSRKRPPIPLRSYARRRPTSGDWRKNSAGRSLPPNRSFPVRRRTSRSRTRSARHRSRGTPAAPSARRTPAPRVSTVLPAWSQVRVRINLRTR